eukprot:5501512-Pyramimonas_sp.AAC.1
MVLLGSKSGVVVVVVVVVVLGIQVAGRSAVMVLKILLARTELKSPSCMHAGGATTGAVYDSWPTPAHRILFFPIRVVRTLPLSIIAPVII